MKHVFDASTVAHYWANQRQQNARNSGGNFYFEGKTIYSYGNHFPIAVIDERTGSKVVIFTTDSYSKTTGKHISEARSASSHYPVILCLNPVEATKNTHKENIDAFERAAKYSANKLPKAVKPGKYLDEIAEQRELLNKYVTYFEVKKSLYKHLHYINIITKEGAIKASAAEQKQIEKAKKEADKQREEQRIKDIAADKALLLKWRKFTGYYNEVSTPRFKEAENTFLRLNKATSKIETSKSVEIPIKVAERFYKWLKHQVVKGGCNGECNQKILGYDVNEVNNDHILIGCHNITWIEINKLAKKLNWL